MVLLYIITAKSIPKEMMEYAFGFVSLYFLTYLLITYLEEEVEEPATGSTPKVSVLIPAYNEEGTIDETIRSVLNLEYPDFEVIVIDDGSTDGTGTRAGKFPIKLLQQKNSGKAEALNNGIKHASGELIATLDADCYVDPSALRHMIGFFSDQRVMAVTPTMKVWKPETMLEKMQKAEYTFSNLMSKIFARLDSITVTPGPFTVYRASVFRKLGGFNGKTLTEDNEMALRIQSADYLIRSSKKAMVYTAVPTSLGALFRQRKRWYAGFWENMKRYTHLFAPRYGELGVFVLPAITVMLVVSLYKMISDALSAASSLASGQAAGSAFIQPFQFLSAAAAVVGLVLFFISMKEARETPSFSMLFHLFLMTLLTPFMYVYAFFRRGYEIITRRAAKW